MSPTEHRCSRRTRCTRLLGNFEKHNLVEAMRILRCTRKALGYLGAAAGTQAQPGDVEGVLKEWYVNLLRIERRNCLLFAEARTLYVFLVPGVVKRDVENLPAFFAERLRMNLLRDGIPDDIALRVAGVEPFHLANTRDRRVLGSMTEFAHLYRYHIEAEGGLARADVQELNRRVNRVPMSMLDMDYSIDVVRSQLAD